MLKFILVKNLTELGYNRIGGLDRNWFCLSALIKKISLEIQRALRGGRFSLR